MRELGLMFADWWRSSAGLAPPRLISRLVKLQAAQEPHQIVNFAPGGSTARFKVLLLGNEHVGTDAAIGGAVDADHARQGRDMPSCRSPLVRVKDTFEFAHWSPPATAHVCLSSAGSTGSLRRRLPA